MWLSEKLQIIRKCFRFSLRTLLLALLILAGILGFCCEYYLLPYQREMGAISRIQEENARLEAGSYQVFTESRGNYFIRQLFGDGFSHRAISVHLASSAVTDDWLKTNLSELREIEVLSIKSANVSDAGLLHLYPLKHLQRLAIVDTSVSEQGLNELKRRLPKLKVVQYGMTPLIAEHADEPEPIGHSRVP